ncbi:MAG: restriction endonuclease subunit S [Actinomycetota bacterium]
MNGDGLSTGKIVESIDEVTESGTDALPTAPNPSAPWSRKPLGAVAKVKYGKGLAQKERRVDGPIPVYGSSGVVGFHSQALVDYPTVVVGRKGNAGSVHLAESGCWPIDTTYFLEIGDEVRPRFLAHQLRSLRLGQLDSSTAIPSLRRQDLEAQEIVTPSIAEQEEVVEEIEKQFTRLDAGVASLRRVQANLRRYRAAVLQAAVTGRLFQREGLPGQPGQPRQMQEGNLEDAPAEIPTANQGGVIPPVPPHWRWARLDEIAEIVGGITKDQKRRSAHPWVEVPYLRVANVQRGYLDLDEMKTIEATEEEIDKLSLKVGDVLFTEGGDRDKLGRGWIWEGQIDPCIHQNHIFRARARSPEILPKFVSWYGNTFGQIYFLNEGKQTTNLASINMTKLKAFPVPIPPQYEQERIVTEVDRRLSLVDELEYEVHRDLLRTRHLRQAVLSRAFAGEIMTPAI